ncbi:hypothetical protein DPMN_051878 [Dreissena polymorpha]|uniref:Uncharacterized protein n=1 Tax=Dreissena polymorpha TaxID=45954 RepID=A0A9D4CKC5_DREPO|nr:hypothetical protein DPMN_051878 [Dreissena polymorpha]
MSMTSLIITHQTYVQQTAGTTCFSEWRHGGIVSVVIRFTLRSEHQSQSVILFVRATAARNVAVIGG